MLFDKKTKKYTTGTNDIPGCLGITKERGDEIIDAIAQSYGENELSTVKVFKEIQEENLSKNESMFASYCLGVTRVQAYQSRKNGMTFQDFLKEIMGE